MAAYWMLFAIPMLAVLMPVRLPARQAWLAWILVWIVFTALIGFRLDVGGDWYNYIEHLNWAHLHTWDETLLLDDPGYRLLNWVSGRLDAGIYLVNTVSAAIVMFGILMFARRQPMPWLALLAAVPYMIIVVAMGYTRQSVAMGLELLALIALASGRTRRFVLLVLVGALFHKTAVLLLPLAALAVTRNRIWTGLWVAVIAASAFMLLVLDSSEALWEHYVTQDMQSEGGMIRVAMNAVPAVILLLFRRRMCDSDTERRLWSWMAIFALACVPLVAMASTATDRVGLYLIPLQMFVFGRINRLANTGTARASLAVGVSMYYTAVLWTWLNFATHAKYWLPYQFGPLH